MLIESNCRVRKIPLLLLLTFFLGNRFQLRLLGLEIVPKGRWSPISWYLFKSDNLCAFKKVVFINAHLLRRIQIAWWVHTTPISNCHFYISLFLFISSYFPQGSVNHTWRRCNFLVVKKRFFQLLFFVRLLHGFG